MPNVVVSVAPVADLPAACRALYSHLPPAEAEPRAVRTLALIGMGEVDPSGLLVARAAGRVVGAALVQFTAGRAAVAWPPRADDGPGRAAALAALGRAVVGVLRERGTKVAQLMLDPDRRADAEPLERAGFRATTRLAYLCRPVAEADAAFAPGPLRFEPAGPTPDFGEALLATYDGSLDCPELNGSRTADEVLAGYLAATGGPAGWFRVTADGAAVGVVVLAAGPQPGVRDLSYLGLVPAARGRGWGDALVRFALAHAAASAAGWLNLSVDVRNAPARRLYDRHRFREYDAQDVFLWRGDFG